MVEIKSFKALRPTEEKINLVNSPPYDVISLEKAADIINKNPYSFLKVIKPESIVMNKRTSEKELIEIASQNLTYMIQQKILRTDSSPCLYIYQQNKDSCSRTGIVACLSVDDYEKGLIKKHEKIRLTTWQGRVEHMYGVRAHTGCVLTVYRGSSQINDILQQSMVCGNEIYNFKSDDGVENICWKINREDIIDLLKEAFQQIPCTYIADGHHRVAAAAEVTKRIRGEENKQNLEKQEYDYFPAVLIPHDQINILGYHRLVKNLPGFPVELFLGKLEETFKIKKLAKNMTFLPTKKYEFGMNIKGQWYQLNFNWNKKNSFRQSIVDDLDVSILQNYILEPLLGIDDPQKNKNIEFIGGEDSIFQLSDKINHESDIAFTVFPTSIEEVIKVSDEGEIMPTKSTWFEPKIRSGIFIHQF